MTTPRKSKDSRPVPAERGANGGLPGPVDQSAGARRDAAPGAAPLDPDPVARDLAGRILKGDREALAQLFSLYRPRLWRMVNFRLHPQLQGRIDADDVLQDAWIKAVDRIGYFYRDGAQSSFIWFRTIVQQTLIELHRRHFGAEKRTVSRDVSINQGWGGESTSSCLAQQLLGQLTSPSSALYRAELANQLDVALQGMNDIDREVLALRHFEELSNLETAQVLNMSEQAASVRYIRALTRLKKILELIPGLHDQSTRTV